MRAIEFLQESLTPPNKFLSKAEKLKAGNKVFYKGKLVGIATGEINGDRVIFKPFASYGNSGNFASLPIDQISLREGKHVQGVAEGNFDSFKFGKPITFTAYHSSDSEIKKILPTDEFYFSDDRYTWEGNYLYKIKITLKNPYVVLDQKAGYEGHATDSLPKIKAAGYDGVIYTPHSVDYGFRQGVCFYPQQQISNIKLVNSDSGK